MNKKDISMIALLFFITRAFFNLNSFNNIFDYIITNTIIIISVFIIKKIKINPLKNKIFKSIYLIIIVLIFITIILITTKFVNNNYFRYDNYFVIFLSLIMTSYFLSNNSIKTIASISEILSVIFIFLSFIVCIGLFSLIDYKNYTNYINYKNISFNILPLLIIFILLYLKDYNIILGYSLGSLSILIDNTLLIGCIGTKLIMKYKFPGVSILKTLNFFHFINHLDKFFSFIHLFEFTITLAIILYIIRNLIKKRTTL